MSPMPFDATPPILVADPAPGSAGQAINAYAATRAELWHAAATTPTSGDGIQELTVELTPWDDLFTDLEALRDALTAGGADVTVDPLPGA